MAILVVLVVLLVASFWFPHRTPLVDASTHKTLDSLKATRAASEVLHDAVVRAANADTARVAALLKEAKQHEAHAQAVHDSAKVLAELAAARDSASPVVDSAAVRWRLAYEASARDADTLRVQVVDLTAANVAAKAAIAKLYIADSTSRARLTASEAVNDKLAAAIAKAEAGCRIIGPIKCPTRTQAFVLGTIVGTVGGIALLVK